MNERNDLQVIETALETTSPDTPFIDTTRWARVNAIDEVCDTDDEAFAVLESMLAEGRISVLATAPARAA